MPGKRALLACLAAVAALTATAAFAAVANPRPQRFTDLVSTDSTGGICAVSRDAPGTLFLARGDTWTRQDIPALAGGEPVLLKALRDGSIACLWALGKTGAISRHRGEEVLEVQEIAVQLHEPQLLECADESLVITEKGPTVVWAAPRGPAKTFHLGDEFFLPGENGDARYYAPVCAVEDGRHRVWLWSYVLDRSNLPWRLATLLLLERGEIHPQRPAGGPPDASFSDIAAADPEHLWLAQTGSGLLSLDIQTLTLSPLPDAALGKVSPALFAYVERFFHEGGDLYAVLSEHPTEFGPMPSPPVEGRINLRIISYFDALVGAGALCRFHDGAWQMLVDFVDEHPRFGWWERPHLLTSAGLLMGSPDSGPWLVHLRENRFLTAARLGWMQDFPLSEAAHFCAAGEGRIAVLDRLGNFAYAALQVPEVPAKEPRQRSFKTRSSLLRDARGHVWGLDDHTNEWDGKVWRKRPAPGGVSAELRSTDWLPDDADGGWLFGLSGKVWLFHFRTAEWQEFASEDAALVSQLPRGVHILNARDPFFSPAFSDDGRVAYFSREGTIRYYDGQKWQAWQMPQIGGNPESKSSGAPFFAKDGRLCVPADWKLFELTAAGEWHEVQSPDAPVTSPHPLPEGGDVAGSEIPGAASTAIDALGVRWTTTASGELFKTLGNVTIPARKPGEHNPFRYGDHVTAALADPEGGVFFALPGWGSPHRYIQWGATAAPPRTTLQLRGLEGDTAAIDLASTPSPRAEEKRWYTWQLDGRAWSPPQLDPKLSLAGLAPGKHRLQVRAADADLNVEITPVSLEWEIQVDPLQQRRQLIAALASPDVERRESAAKALRAQGVESLPALREARSTAGKDQRWWIDAVIQGIERDGAGGR